MPLPFAETELVGVLVFSSAVIVEAEREKVLARGPRCVSLSSNGAQVSNPSSSRVNEKKLSGQTTLRRFNGSCWAASGWIYARIVPTVKNEAGLTLGQVPRHVDGVVGEAGRDEVGSSAMMLVMDREVPSVQCSAVR
jgi:hypothetical protein